MVHHQPAKKTTALRRLAITTWYATASLGAIAIFITLMIDVANLSGTPFSISTRHNVTFLLESVLTFGLVACVAVDQTMATKGKSTEYRDAGRGLTLPWVGAVTIYMAISLFLMVDTPVGADRRVGYREPQLTYLWLIISPLTVLIARKMRARARPVWNKPAA